MVHRAAGHARKHRLSHPLGARVNLGICIFVRYGWPEINGSLPKLKLMCDGKVICARWCMERALRARKMVGCKTDTRLHEDQRK
jgi:hypothetical protein